MSVPGIQTKEYMPDLSLVGSHVTVLQPLGYKHQASQSRFDSGSLKKRHAVLPDISKVASTSPEQNFTDRTLIQQSSTQSIVGSTLVAPASACSVIPCAESRVDSVQSEPNTQHGTEDHKNNERISQPYVWKDPKVSPENVLLKLEQFNENSQMQHSVIQSVNSHRLPLCTVSLNHAGNSEPQQKWHDVLLREATKHASREEESDQNEEVQDEYSTTNRKLSAKNRPRKIKRKKKSHKGHANKSNWAKVRSKSAGCSWQPASGKAGDDSLGPLIMAECKSIAVLPAPIKVSKPRITALMSNKVSSQTTPRSHRLTMGTMASMSANGTSSLHSGHVRVTMQRSAESLPHHVMKSGMPAVERVHRIVKVFCSDKHSGVLKELGMEVPCAPPATPTPDMLSKYEYIPSLNDVRSQRAVKIRLETLEKLEKKRQEKMKDEKSKREKQELKDKEKELKKRQRLEIYALNKVMTEFENANFLEFCKKNGLNV